MDYFGGVFSVNSLVPAVGYGTADAEIKPSPHSPPLYPMGVQGLQRFPLSKPGVGQSIALHAAPADRTFTYLVSV